MLRNFTTPTMMMKRKRINFRRKTKLQPVDEPTRSVFLDLLFLLVLRNEQEDRRLRRLQARDRRDEDDDDDDDNDR